MSNKFALSDIGIYPENMSKNHEIPTSDPAVTPSLAKGIDGTGSDVTAISVPDHVVSSGALEKLAGTARDYARHALADNTNAAYKADWAHFNRWCRRRGADPLPPSPALIGLYLADCASPDDTSPALSVATIERRLSGLVWHYTRRGVPLDRKDRHIATVLAGIRRRHARPPVQKEAVLAGDIIDMIATLSFGLRDMRDRAILLVGYAGGLRRSEIVGLDVNRDDTDDGNGWISIEDAGLILTFRGKTGWRDVEVARGSGAQTCPVHALEQYLLYSRTDFGPVFQRVRRDDRKTTGNRLSDKHVARLIKKTVRDAGIRADLPESERVALFSGHSLRAGLASGADVDERYVQKQLGHASPEMTRRYQRRRDRFRVNLTKAAGL
jgi:integrase